MLKSGRLLKELLETSYFRFTVVEDEETVEMCGALKVIIACFELPWINRYLCQESAVRRKRASFIRLFVYVCIEYCSHGCGILLRTRFGQ
jgi:hypothetical protein